MSVTALTAGTTSLTITAGGVTKTIPVTVKPNYLAEIPEGTRNGVTLKREGTGVTITGQTPTQFTAWEVDFTLEAGRYLLDGDGLFVKISPKGSNAGVLDTRHTLEKTLEAGEYTMSIGLASNQTVPTGVRHPYLEKLD